MSESVTGGESDVVPAGERGIRPPGTLAGLVAEAYRAAGIAAPRAWAGDAEADAGFPRMLRVLRYAFELGRRSASQPVGATETTEATEQD